MFVATILGFIALGVILLGRVIFKEAMTSLGSILGLTSIIWMFCSHFLWGIPYFFIAGTTLFTAIGWIYSPKAPKKNPHVSKAEDDFRDSESQISAPYKIRAPYKLIGRISSLWN